ncbi:hypothetical protein FB45DRAFT_278878 [Roridomyces roridus]|uniref:Uncharacterized protein n=1 Tax=Roridomyces roridus TaxID=1738132 RepID=A0AAD7CC25_9AGAR|nr:hypothetical protein FB45DRAFT_278878 [Roridomyces roridus]
MRVSWGEFEAAATGGGAERIWSDGNVAPGWGAWTWYVFCFLPSLLHLSLPTPFFTTIPPSGRCPRRRNWAHPDSCESHTFISRLTGPYSSSFTAHQAESTPSLIASPTTHPASASLNSNPTVVGSGFTSKLTSPSSVERTTSPLSLCRVYGGGILGPLCGQADSVKALRVVCSRSERRLIPCKIPPVD